MAEEFLQAIHAAPRPLLLDNLRIPGSLTLACLAPHPDDFDAIGVTMRRFRENGNRIELGVVTSGASGVEDAFCTNPSPAAKASIRELEQRASCKFFGLPPEHLFFLHLDEDEDGHPLVSKANIGRIKSFLTSKNPNVIVMPHGNDSNEGHRRTYRMVSELMNELKLSLIALLNRDPKTIAMRKDLFTIFKQADADWKAQLLRFHQSQQQRNLRTRQKGFDERILSVNREMALVLGQMEAYAEVFEIELYEGGFKSADLHSSPERSTL